MKRLERIQRFLQTQGMVRVLGAVLILFVGAAFVMLSSHSLPWGRTEAGTVRFGVLVSAAAAPYFVGQEQHFFDGISVTPVRYEDGAKLVSDLLAGRLHLGYVGSVPTLMAATQVAPVEHGGWLRKPPKPTRIPVQHHSQVAVLAVASLSEGAEGILVRPELGMETTADLAERRIAVSEGTTSHRFLLEAIRNAGLEVGKDVTLLDMDPEELLEAYRLGTVDAVAAWEPYKHRLIEAGARLLLDDNQAVVRSYDLLTANTAWAATHPEEIAFLLQTHYRATTWMNEHPREAAEVIARFLEQSSKEVEYILELYRRPSREEHEASDDFRKTVQRDMVSHSQFLYNLGLIERLPNVDRLLWAKNDLNK